MSNDFYRQDSFGLLNNNPVLVHLLGLSPVLAVSSTLAQGIAMGLATVIVLLCSTLLVSLLRDVFDNRWRYFYFMMILACLTSIVDFLMQLAFYPMYSQLGIYVPLICCNFAILINLETVASHNEWKKSLVPAMMIAAGYMLALILLSSARELLSNGSLLEGWQLLLPGSIDQPILREAETGDSLFPFATYQPAALVLLGLLIALWNGLIKLSSKAQPKEAAIVPVKRERVTGKVGAKT